MVVVVVAWEFDAGIRALPTKPHLVRVPCVLQLVPIRGVWKLTSYHKKHEYRIYI